MNQVLHVPSLPNVDLLGLLSSLGFLALLFLGLIRLRRMSSRLETLETTAGEGLARLEHRLWEGVNKMFVEVRGPIERRLEQIEKQLDKMPPEAIAHAERMKPIVALAEIAREKFPIVRGGQIIKEWTRDEIRGLPTSQKNKLSEDEPELWKWYLST